MRSITERVQERAAQRVEQERATQPITEILPVVDPPPPSVIDPLAQRLSDVLRDPDIPERERVRLRQIVSLVLADRRRA